MAQASITTALMTTMPHTNDSHQPSSTAPRSLLTRILDIFLGTDVKQRLRLTRSLLASLVFFICIGVIAYFTEIGGMDSRHGLWLSLGMMSTCVLFYAALRSGFNQRFHDPALTLPQVLIALTWITSAYAVSGSVHGGLLILLALVMVFGILTMSARSSAISATYSLAILSATMLYKVKTDPQNYPLDVELVYFVLVVAVIPTIAALATQITHMRDTLKNQKYELEQALAHIQKLAAHDELTGLVNRRRMTEILRDHLHNQEREPTGFAIAMLDLDHFKRINDTYGHAVGDDVLSGFAEAARQTLRKADVLSRWGGEEFLLLMPETNNGDPNTGIERLRHLLADLVISKNAPDLRVTFSAGISRFSLGENLADTIKRADDALYAAKANGRNRTVVH